ncbi:MAG: hypothetical protein IJE44_04880 [Clostridia bacterium]|nr:hypothetical protein [Clostridia bacterium]
MKNTNAPITFGKVLIENSEAMDKYLRLPKNIQEKILYTSEQITSEKEMQAFVNSINDL